MSIACKETGKEFTKNLALVARQSWDGGVRSSRCYEYTNKLSSRPIRESTTVLDSGFHAIDSGFKVLDSGFLELYSGFQVLDFSIG